MAVKVSSGLERTYVSGGLGKESEWGGEVYGLWPVRGLESPGSPGEKQCVPLNRALSLALPSLSDAVWL